MSDEDSHLNEPEAKYGTSHSKRKIIFFNSFEESEEYGLKQMASHSYEERLSNLETLRKRSFNHLRLPDGNRPPLKKTITIEFGTYK